MTWRQFLAWQHRLREQWNQPNRTDNYLMLIACEVRRVLSKHPERINPKDFKLVFTFKDKPVDREVQAAFTKSRWFALTGYIPKT